MNQPMYTAMRNAVGIQRPAKLRHLVAIRNPDSDSPLFCIHPSGGDVGIYRKLATRLDSSRSIWGIQSRLLCGAKTEFASLEEMACEYTQIIEEKQPTGPIRMLGFSLGGFLAALMAKNFYQSGRHVSFLGMIDSNPGWIAASETSRQELCLRLTQLFTKFQNIGVMHQKPIESVERDVRSLVDMCLKNKSISPDETMAKTVAMGYVPDDELATGVLMKFTSNFLKHISLLDDFHPPELSCPLHLWWPSETMEGNRSGAKIWSQCTSAKTTDSVIKGGHYSIMRGSAVRALASEIDSAIEYASELSANTVANS